AVTRPVSIPGSVLDRQGGSILDRRRQATVRWGMTIFFARSVDAPVARFLAERLNLQTRMPAQFSLPSVTLPTITQTVRQVRAGDAGLRELLVVGCRVTGINPGDALKLL
ncbi:MAG: hypothetical protein Q8K45_02145, partial [Rubrivivax sp.]|nr:hypothetical protein [Rubrivivax sp.]